ncbi:MAG: hypothetical protein FWE12_04815 [Oscillospiraceae bacterium]|nr:hypothetical protein [Oscillospiraceae bacterium]
MSRERRNYTAGSSAYDLDRVGALPEIEYIEYEEPRRGERPRPAPDPSPERVGGRVAARVKEEARANRRQTVPVFGIFGCLLAGMLLLLVVLSHMQLAMLSSEIVQTERQMTNLRVEAVELLAVHEAVFSRDEVERFAREELGMAEATRGQVVFIGSSVSGDVAEVLRAEEPQSFYGMVDHVAGLFGILQESWGSIFGRQDNILD